MQLYRLLIVIADLLGIGIVLFAAACGLIQQRIVARRNKSEEKDS